MRVGWVSHQMPRADDAPAPNPALLPGRYAGGAEFLQDKMRSRAPDGIEWVLIDPRTDPDLSALETVERTIVCGLELLSHRQVEALIPREPLVWAMSAQHPQFLPLLAAASPLVWASERMRSWYPWAPDGEICQGWFDTTAIPRSDIRNGRAVWAARNHPQKGLMQARVWAAEHGVPLDVLTNVPRQQVLNAMADATYFVLLATDHDPAPIAVAEAQVAGCEVITNGNVGRAPVDGADEVARWIEAQPGRFYSWL